MSDDVAAVPGPPAYPMCRECGCAISSTGGKHKPGCSWPPRPERNPDVAEVLAETIATHLSERIDYHGPYGATSEEQWQMDTEKRFVRELNDGELVADILKALTATGYACVYVPKGVAVAHGARLVPRDERMRGAPVRLDSLYAIEDSP